MRGMRPNARRPASSALSRSLAALGRKVSDEFTVPLCRLHHSELHRYGDEVSWWAGVNVDPVPIALALWRGTRRDGTASPDP